MAKKEAIQREQDQGNRMFTAGQEIVIYKAGTLTVGKMQEVPARIVDILAK